MIILDSTEARSNTRLPQPVIDAAQVIDGFESLTGADMLISPLSEPKLPNKLTESTLHKRLLQKHTKAGILVQRKDGLDLLNSIPDLCNIEKRMSDWCGDIGPWLLVIGTFIQRKDGRLFVNGQEVDLRYDIKSIRASLDWWQLRGGGLTELYSARHITAWVNHWHQSMLHKLNTEPEKLVIDLPPAQKLTGAEDTWWTPLAVVPGIGEKKAQVLAEWLPESERTLAHAICYLCDERNINRDRPPGFGKKTFLGTKEFFGLTNHDILCLVSVLEERPELKRLIWPRNNNLKMKIGQQWSREDGRIEMLLYETEEKLEKRLELVGVMAEEEGE